MQSANANVALRITGLHVTVTDALRAFITEKLRHLHLDYPRIIEAHTILDVQKYRQSCEVVLHCANHITIEADAETDDMYAAIESAVTKVGQQMRKYKTRLARTHRSRHRDEVRHMDEQILTLPDDFTESPLAQPTVVQTERYPVKPMYVEEAVLQMEMSPRQFVVFLNAQTEKVNILHRRKDGSYGLMEPTF